jgi:hypothetical protein
MKKSLSYIAFLFLVIVVVLELSLRLAGYQTFQLPDYHSYSDPKEALLPHPTKGIFLAPGSFEISIQNHGNLNYQLNHTPDSQRSTGYQKDSIAKPRVVFYGCSFTYGSAVSDKASYPFILQQKFPQLQIENRAVPSYGQVQLLMELRNNPNYLMGVDHLIINYLSFHNERNSMNRNYREKLRLGFLLSQRDRKELSANFAYPYAVLEEDSLYIKQLEIKRIKSFFPLRRYLAISQQAELVLNHLLQNEQEELATTEAIFKEIASHCRQKGVAVSVSFMDNKDQRIALQKSCKHLNINTIDLSIDWSKEENSLLPVDPHPSGIAHQLFAQKLQPLLERITLSN